VSLGVDELDSGAEPLGRARQMDALPLTRHAWHGDWNYTLYQTEYDPASGAPAPFDQPSPCLAWLAHPALAGLPACERDALLATLMTLRNLQREANVDTLRAVVTARGWLPPAPARRPVLTLADRLLATVLHQRLALPQVAIAALLKVRPETINRRIRENRRLLEQAGYAIQPGPHRLASLDYLYRLVAAAGIAIPSEIKTAC
jgi:hypothetical protein